MSIEQKQEPETDGGQVQTAQSSQSQAGHGPDYLVDLPVKGYEVGETLSDYSTFSRQIHQSFRRFVGAVAEACDIDGTFSRSRYSRSQHERVEYHQNRRGRLLDRGLCREDPCVLLVFPDHSRMFIGRDATATDSGLFGFVVKQSDPIAPPNTCDEALDLLKPAGVKQAAVESGDEPARQGEWWILPADGEPASRAFKPGVQSRPYGPSPLDNHVPREYALGISEGEFMRRFRSAVPERGDYFDSAPEVIEWVTKQHHFDGVEDIKIPDYVPTLQEVREWAGEVYVRGTLRHRENDHYMENLGDEWHVARTHTMDVFTADITPDVAITARVD